MRSSMNDNQIKIAVVGDGAVGKTQLFDEWLNQENKFDEIESEIPKNMTGADFYGLVSQATIFAKKRTIQQGLEEMELEIEDLREAIKSVRPSVSEQELLKYDELRKKYQ